MTRFTGPLAVLGLLLALATPAAATAPGKNGLIAFSGRSDRSSIVANIWTVPFSGKGASQVTRCVRESCSAGGPAWSPDGKRIAYVRRGGAIVIARADGRGAHAVSDQSLAPCWSPDGREIAFWLYDRRLVRMSLRTRRMRVIGGADAFPAVCDWSSRDRIAYWQLEGPESGFDSVIYTQRLDGSDLRQVASLPGERSLRPSWSPGGTQLMFTDRNDTVIVGARGGEIRRFRGPQNYPTWSPDGRRVVSSSRRAEPELYVHRTDGRLVRKFKTPVPPGAPSWQPVPRRR